MPVKIQNTRDIGSDGVKCLVYSRAGVGKTVLSSTAPAPIVISAEQGLLSLAETDTPYIEVKTIDDIRGAFTFLQNSEEAKQYKTVCLDSISDIAEVLLAEFKSTMKDARQAYGEMADNTATLVRAFRDFKNVNVYVIAKVRRIVDDVGISTFVPSAPGKMLPDALPYLFDLVMPMKIGKLDTGETYRYLQTQPDMQWEAKDRSGKLNPIEEPNLTNMFNKITGGK